jgi:chitinase
MASPSDNNNNQGSRSYTDRFNTNDSNSNHNNAPPYNSSYNGAFNNAAAAAAAASPADVNARIRQLATATIVTGLSAIALGSYVLQNTPGAQQQQQQQQRSSQYQQPPFHHPPPPPPFQQPLDVLPIRPREFSPDHPPPPPPSPPAHHAHYDVGPPPPPPPPPPASVTDSGVSTWVVPTPASSSATPSVIASSLLPPPPPPPPPGPPVVDGPFGPDNLPWEQRQRQQEHRHHNQYQHDQALTMGHSHSRGHHSNHGRHSAGSGGYHAGGPSGPVGPAGPPPPPPPPPPPHPPHPPSGPGYRSVAYFVNWAIYGRKHFPQDLPVENLTHILYAFANVRTESGEVFLTDDWADTDIHFDGDSWNDVGTNMYGCLKQLNLHKRRNRNLKILLSIGGWTYSPNFRQPMSTADGRAAFARSAVRLIKDMGFDGIDIDWEYPETPAEAADLVELLRVCRQEMDAYSATLPPPPPSGANPPSHHGHHRGYHFELTVACPAAPAKYNVMDLRGMDRYLDFWNLMAYDFAGSWDSSAGHQANLYSSRTAPQATPFCADGSVSGYVSAGIAPAKLVLGMPLYGRAFENTDGPGCPFSGIGPGSWEPGVYDYKALPLPAAETVENREIGASWCYDRARRLMVSYDTVNVARHKAEFIRDRRLGGAMWWESSADKSGPDSIISAVVNTLGGPRALLYQQNCIEYPESKYENMRRGFS